MSRAVREPQVNRSGLYVAVVALVVAVVAIALAVVALDEDDDPDGTAGGTTTVLAGTTTTEPQVTTTAPTTTTTTAATTTTPVPTTTPTTDAVDATTAVFPFRQDDLRFTDPVAAASSYAKGVLGFVDPVYTEFRQGDSRSGEVGVRPVADGPETTILVRQLGADDTWWVLGAASEHLVLHEPAALEVLTSPVALRGEALAFEGNVSVELWTDRAAEPLATTTVTGGGDQLRPFDGTLTFDRQPAAGGAIVLRSYGGEDGRVWEAAVVRVRFAEQG